MSQDRFAEFDNIRITQINYWERLNLSINEDANKFKKTVKWSKYFFEMVKVIKTLSKDQFTKVGCVIVGPANEVRSTGYNSFPRGIQDDLPERQVRPEKYFWFEHSERNAIFNAARVGIPLEGCIIYMEGIPCMDCARAIIQAGIREIIYNGNESDKWNSPKYDKTMLDKSIKMLTEAGVRITEIRFLEKKTLPDMV